ncbi:MAG: hypothetical protein MUD02_11715, partial [Bacteroidales bacterium]|nr:hypothetical protein [Bacteroidales bacterium]
MRKLIYAFAAALLLSSCAGREKDFNPSFRLVPADRIEFNSFVDCNMAAAWIGDTFRIFPGKYGEDPLWGDAAHLMFADGMNADEA